ERAEQPEQRRVRRGGPLGKQQRPDTSADECAGGEAAEREPAAYKPPPEAESREYERERDDQPVERCHPPCSTATLTTERRRSATSRRAARARRAWPVVAMAAVAFAIGAIVGGSGSSDAKRSLAERFVAAWTQGDYAAMYLDLDPASRAATNVGEFTQAYRSALTTSTATRLRTAGAARESQGGRVEV